MELTRADADSEQSATVGEEIVVRLEEAPTTGYRWQPETAGLELLEDRYDPPSGSHGGTGYRVLRYRASTAGSAEVQAVERRPWESSAVDRFRVSLTVRPSR
jgi:inhibitor of cysteine peptidase